MRLPNLEGYLKFPGPFPVASIRLKYVARGEAAARFVPREGDGAAPAPDDGGMPISEKGTRIDVVVDGEAEPDERAPEPLALAGRARSGLRWGEASPAAERRMTVRPDDGSPGNRYRRPYRRPEFETAEGTAARTRNRCRRMPGAKPPAAQPPAAPADWG